MTDTMAKAAGLLVVTDERRLPRPPLPETVTPEWLDKQLNKFATALKVDFVTVLNAAKRTPMHEHFGTGAGFGDSPREQFYTVAQLCELWQASRRSVTRWIETGRLKAIKIGGLTRIRESDARAFERSGIDDANRAFDVGDG